MRTRSFQGKVAAITGAASGIGRALAVALAGRGCELALGDLDEAGLAAAAASLQRVRVSTRRLDVSSAEEMRAWADGAAREHGRVNLIFNIAGISYGATVRGAEDADFRRLMDVNFWGVVHGTRAFLPHLEASGDGHVVNMSSVFGLIGFPGQSAYNAAKFAVRGFTEALQMECAITGSAVRATCVCSGGVKTNIARATKIHSSMAELGVDLARATEDFDQAARLTPGEAAEIILRGVQRNARRVLVGTDARIMDLLQRLWPQGYQAIVARSAFRLARRPAGR